MLYNIICFNMFMNLTGMLWQKVKQVYEDGIQAHFESLYNYFDFAVLTVYITSFTLRFFTLMKVWHFN